MKIILIAILSFSIGLLLTYGALKTAEQIAKPHVDRIEAFRIERDGSYKL